MYAIGTDIEGNGEEHWLTMFELPTTILDREINYQSNENAINKTKEKKEKEKKRQNTNKYPPL